MSEAQTRFDPSRYLTKVGGSDYLEVKWRLVWLRDVHPDAEIVTEDIRLDQDFAVFKATISIPGGGSATGYGSETAQDFRDHIEKSETKAIGRALAALGFGTQFCPDFDFGADHGKVVDSPVNLSSRRPTPSDAPGRPQPATRPAAPPNRPPAASRPVSASSDGPPLSVAQGGRPMTEKQSLFLIGLAKDLGMTIVGPDGANHHDERAMDADCQQRYGCAFQELSAGQASELIEDWKARRGGRE